MFDRWCCLPKMSPLTLWKFVCRTEYETATLREIGREQHGPRHILSVLWLLGDGEVVLTIELSLAITQVISSPALVCRI